MPILGADFVRSKNREVRQIHGRALAIAGPGIQVADGAGWTIARTGTGTYVITFDKKYAKFLGGSGAEVVSGTNFLVCRVSAYSIANSTVTIIVFNSTTGAAADLAAGEELWFEFQVGFSQRS